MKILNKFVFLWLFISPFTTNAQSWMDRSHTIFLPDTIQEPLSVQMDFPSFWWNFVVIEPTNGKPSFELAQSFCSELPTVPPKLVKKSACPDISAFLPLLESWSQDLFRRHYAPSIADIETALKEGRTKAAMSFGPELLKVIRMDPLETYKDLQSLLVKNVSLGFDKENGFFIDRDTQRIIIPVQLDFSPQETSQTRTLVEDMTKRENGKAWAWVGPHIAAFENETQVLKDVDMISVFGTVLLILQLAFVFITRRYSYLWLIPPMMAGVFGAGVLTILIYGSIHGLTLSLGTGLIALALDFGLHSIHNIRWKGVWKANLFGLLTTYAGLLAISLSAIPLLRQMMVFAALGLTLSYVFYYLFHTRFPKLVEVRAFTYVPKTHILKTVVALSLVVLGIIGAFFLRPDLNMHQFDSQTLKTRTTLVWLYSHIHQRMPLFSVRPISENTFKEAHEQNAWGLSNKINLSNFEQFLSSPDVQLQKQRSWQTLCSPIEKISDAEKVLFEPFLKAFPCKTLSARTLHPPPPYISDAVTDTRWLTTWFPENDDQVRAIKNYDTQAFALGELIQQFPKILARELLWMVPLSLAICLFLLWLYYREWLLSTISLVPFFTGVGAYFLCVFVLGWGYSFISVIGLIMVFGLSIDYGIFAANLFLLKEPPPREGVWSCLLLASTVTILGFLPLVFCTHPVLVHLGQTLVMGSIGTWLGTVWGIPGIFALLKRELK